MKNLLMLITLLFSLNSFSQTLAFPCAVGAAATQVTGGRGGNVLHVTNLNDSGVGSLRAALEATGTRTIVFDVSGVINASSDINVGDGNFTIAGQSAPKGGITIIGTNNINVTGKNNWVMRYIRFRNGYDDLNVDGGWANTSSVSTRNANFFIYDHCSIGLSKETAGLGGGMNDYGYNIVFTAQNSLVVESDRGTRVGDSNDDDPSTITIYRNGYINSGWRFPSAGGTFDMDVINNYVYNWEYRTIRTDAHDYKLNIINNSYEAGNLTRLTDNPEILFTTHTDSIMNPQIWDEGTLITPYTYNGGFSTYDPTPVGYPADLSKGWDPFYASTVPINPAWFASSRLTLNGNTPDILSSTDVKNFVLNNSGANKYIDDNGNVQIYRDSIDIDAIALSQTAAEGTMKYAESQYESLSLALVGTTHSNTRPPSFYQSNPHIPEVWLIANGITGTPTIHNQVQPSGYTLLEEYLNQVDTCVNGPVTNTCSGKNTPVATIGSPLAGNYVKNDTLSFSVNYTSDTTVTSVTYYLNGSVFISTTNPFTFDTTALPEGSHTIFAEFTDACGNTSNTDTVNITITGLTVQACNTTNPPTIDGIEETIWDNITQHELAVTENGLPYPDTNTLKANYKVMWDATSLYFFIKVKDDTLVSDSPQLDFFRDDAVSIYIDVADNNSTTYDADDYFFGFRQGSTDININGVIYSGSAITKTDVVTTEGYNMEVKIDWAYLGLTPNTTNPIGLDFRVDDDDNGGSREHHLLWNDETSTLWGDPSKFGVLMLTNTSCYNTTSINNINENELLIYPNPTNGEVTIKSNEQLNKIEVYNALGSLIFNQNNINTKTKSLNLNKLPKGVYSIKIYQKNKIVEQQLIKQ